MLQAFVWAVVHLCKNFHSLKISVERKLLTELNVHNRRIGAPPTHNLVMFKSVTITPNIGGIYIYTLKIYVLRSSSTQPLFMKVKADDDRNNYCCQIHQSSELVLPTISACIDLSAHCYHNLTYHHYDFVT